ncbi:heme-dependent oxidative N-demethylase family protein [Roseibium algae]|uniref:DUF3445 domain-containing protein n=1 Tax=Roseibium algae TaxID=3123038 RepID=A0ABU8TH65_9HYPH
MAFDHTPYDGTTQPFTVGLGPIEETCWMEPDDHLVAHLERKAALLRTARDAVFRQEEGTADAQAETLELIVEHLRRCHSNRYDVSKVELQPVGLDPSFLGRDSSPLVTAAQLVQEDLILMRPGADGYRLAAACLCFPSSWSLAEKFSQSMHDIHAGVPGFNTGRVGAIVGRIFENLKVGQLIGRFNWSIYDDDELHHPQTKRIDPTGNQGNAGFLAQLFMRVERQTLRRLPGSGDILFTIKNHHDPLAALSKDPRRIELADGLKSQLLGLDRDQLAYKGLSVHLGAMVRELEMLAASEEGATA